MTRDPHPTPVATIALDTEGIVMADRPTSRGNRYAGGAPSRPAPDRDSTGSSRARALGAPGSAGDADGDGESTGDGRVLAALEALGSDTIHRTISTLPKRELEALRGLLRVPAMLLRESDNAARVIQQRAGRMGKSERIDLALSLAAGCNDETVDALGEKHRDPSVADMQAVLDPIVEHHGAPIVALMMAAYVEAAAPCADAFAEILDTDARFAPSPRS